MENLIHQAQEARETGDFQAALRLYQQLQKQFPGELRYEAWTKVCEHELAYEKLLKQASGAFQHQSFAGAVLAVDEAIAAGQKVGRDLTPLHQQKEELYFRNCTTVQGCNEYLHFYPGGRYVKQVEEKKRKLLSPKKKPAQNKPAAPKVVVNDTNPVVSQKPDKGFKSSRVVIGLIAGMAVVAALVWNVNRSDVPPPTATGQELATIGKSSETIFPHKNIVWQVGFSPDGKNIWTGSNDDTVRMWNKKGQILKTFSQPGTLISAAAFSADGKFLVTGGNKRITIYDVEKGTEHGFEAHRSLVTTVAFSPDGKYIVTGGHDDLVKLWNTQGVSLQVFKKHTSDVRSVAFSPDGNYILTASLDGTTILWNKKGNTIQTFQNEISVYSAAFSPDGNYVLTGDGKNGARLWNMQGESRQINSLPEAIHLVCFSPDGKYILTGSYEGVAKLWDERGNVLQEFVGHKASIHSVAFSPDGQYVLTGGQDGTARLWPVSLPQ